MKNAHDFLEFFNRRLSPLVRDERVLNASFDPPWDGLDDWGTMFLDFYNLPESRLQSKRGGETEANNNRMLFSVTFRGPSPQDLDAPVMKSRVETLASGIAPKGHRLHKLRSRYASSMKIAIYLAEYLNRIASEFPPRLSPE